MELKNSVHFLAVSYTYIKDMMIAIYITLKDMRTSQIPENIGHRYVTWQHVTGIQLEHI
jgi:hypothetical protein